MIPGYNHNVKYKEKMFHVQTEDSGVKNPHIITLLYYGGNILKSVRSSYADHATAPDLDKTLPITMQKQHKDVLRGLVTGNFDTLIAERSKGAAFLNGPAPINVAEGSQHQASFSVGGSAKAKPSEPSAPAAAPAPAPENINAPADGSFSTQGSLLDAMAQAVRTLDAADLQKALDSDDDSYVFGVGDTKGLDLVMLDFLKGQ